MYRRDAWLENATRLYDLLLLCRCRHLGLRKVTLEQRREMEEMIAQGLPGDLGYH